jgi:hypothetical protein
MRLLLSISREIPMPLNSNVEPKFYLRLSGVRPSDQHEYSLNLGPWKTLEGAIRYSDQLTDTRIGEQLLNKLGVTDLNAYEG